KLRLGADRKFCPPHFAYSLLAILDPARTAGPWGTEFVPTQDRDDATISMESGQELPPGSLTDVDQRLLEYCPHGPGRRARVDPILSLAGIRDPPDGTRAVVSHKERAVRRHGHADRTAPDVSIPGDETDQEVFVLSRGLTVFHWHADHLVAGPAGTVPRAMLGSKRVEPVLLRELAAVIEGQVERRRVRLNKHVGNNHLVLELGVLSLVPGPAKIPSTYDRRFESSPTSGRRIRDESHHHQGNRDCWPPASFSVRPSILPAVGLDATRLRDLQGRMFAREREMKVSG